MEFWDLAASLISSGLKLDLHDNNKKGLIVGCQPVCTSWNVASGSDFFSSAHMQYTWHAYALLL